MTIAPTTMVRATPGVLSRVVGDHIVLLSPTTGEPAVIYGCGRMTWELVRAPVSLERVVELLAAEFGQESETIAEPVLAALRDLHERGVLETVA